MKRQHFEITEMSTNDAYFNDGFVGITGRGTIREWGDGWFGCRDFVFDIPVIVDGEMIRNTTLFEFRYKLVNGGDNA
jgi:hypothetical protein